MPGGNSSTFFTNPFANTHDNPEGGSQVSPGGGMQKLLPGVNSTGAYLVAGIPFVVNHSVTSGQVDKITFPRVTRSITIINRDAGDNHDIHIAFAQKTHAFDHHRITLTQDRDSITLNVRCKEIFVKGVGGNCDYELIAELTPILSGEFPGLDSANNAGITTNEAGTNWEITENVTLD